jgi:hypothetical protein
MGTDFVCPLPGTKFLSVELTISYKMLPRTKTAIFCTLSQNPCYPYLGGWTIMRRKVPVTPDSLRRRNACFTLLGCASPHALFVSRPSKVPFIENNISLIEFVRERSRSSMLKSQCRNI